MSLDRLSRRSATARPKLAPRRIWLRYSIVIAGGSAKRAALAADLQRSEALGVCPLASSNLARVGTDNT